MNEKSYLDYEGLDRYHNLIQRQFSNIYTKDEVDNRIDGADGHDYIEIGGIKWATMNIGANSITDTGLYFQWGDIQGYTSEQIGSGEGQKYFDWVNYKYSDGTVQAIESNMTKYNSTDQISTLTESDDAATVIWGGNWRIPTSSEYNTLLNSTTHEYTTIDGINGILFTDNSDSSKTLFFPADGNIFGDNIYNTSSVFYFTNTLDANYTDANIFAYTYTNEELNISSLPRFNGCSIRAILDTNKYATKSELSTKASKVSNAHGGNFVSFQANGDIEDSGYNYADLTNKADKVTSATTGNFAGLDNEGNLTDSGNKASDFILNEGLNILAYTTQTNINDYVNILPTANSTLLNKRACVIGINTSGFPQFAFFTCKQIYANTYGWVGINNGGSQSKLLFTHDSLVYSSNYTIPDIYAMQTYVSYCVRTSIVSVSSNIDDDTYPTTVNGNTVILQNGQQITVIYKNEGSSDYTVTISNNSGYKTPDGQQIRLTCPQGGYCKVNYLKINDTIFVKEI